MAGLENTAKALAACIREALEDAYNEKSALPETVLSMEGMTGRMTRHFYNSLIRRVADFKGDGKLVNYLEVGTWKGSSLISALHGNKKRTVATVVDNWSEFNGPRDEFKDNVARLLDDETKKKLTVLDQDCFSVKIPAQLQASSVDVYLYDGGHSYEEQYRGITHFAAALADVAVVLVDDWNWSATRKGTKDGLRDASLEVVYKQEVRHTYDGTHSPNELAVNQFWNGIGIFVVKQSSNSSSRRQHVL